jgi:ketosteroid isomerase-like protein
MAKGKTELVEAVYAAYAEADREAIEGLMADEFWFVSPADPQGMDRAGYFERCWPGAGGVKEFDLVRAVENGDEVIVTYEATRADGTRFRNTEVLTFDGDKQTRAEVYFGWDL